MWGVGEEDRRTRSSFFFNDTATTEIYTLSLHDALPILHPGEAPEPVPDEVRRILRDDASLAQDPLPEVANEPDDLGVGLFGGDDLQELQVARRVEEVRAEEALLKALTAALR